MSCFIGKSHSEEYGAQNYVVFQRIYRCFYCIVDSNYILEWKSKAFSDESIKPLSAPDNFLNSSLNYLGTRARVRFSGNCLKQETQT